MRREGVRLIIYVSGRIKDYAESKAHFEHACRRLKMMGHEPINPHELGEEGMTPEQFMKDDILEMLNRADAVYMLEGWEYSAGGRVEHLVAIFCGLEIYYERQHSDVPPVFRDSDHQRRWTERQAALKPVRPF